MALVENDEWVARLKSEGETQSAALEELRDVLLRGLTAASRNRYSSKLQVEDVVQDSLIKILDKLDTFEGRSKFTTWAMTIAMRMAISEMRRKHFKDVSIEALTTDSLRFDLPDADTPEHGQAEEKTVVLKRLSELIETDLTPKQRDAVHSLLHGMPVEVFAEKTASNRNAVYKLIHDARVKLRHGLESSGFMAEDINSVFA